MILKNSYKLLLMHYNFGGKKAIFRLNSNTSNKQKKLVTINDLIDIFSNKSKNLLEH